MQCKTGCVFVLLGKEQQSTQGLSGQDLAARCRAPEEHWHSFHPSPRNATSLGCGPAEAQAGMWACGLGSRSDLERGLMDGLGGPWKWGQGQAKSTSGDGGGCQPMGEALCGTHIKSTTDKQRQGKMCQVRGESSWKDFFHTFMEQPFMPVSDQMVAYFYPDPREEAWGPDANSPLSHVHPAALSIKEMLLLQFWDVKRRD